MIPSYPADVAGLSRAVASVQESGRGVRNPGQIGVPELYFVRKAGLGAAGQFCKSLLLPAHYPININELLLIPRRLFYFLARRLHFRILWVKLSTFQEWLRLPSLLLRNRKIINRPLEPLNPREYSERNGPIIKVGFLSILLILI